jgi:multidrug efflux pump subunit AcrA (membrane-fusion protein)
MKITKQRLKEIIKEELKNSQNEGFFSRVGASLGRKNKMHGYAFPQFKKVFDKFRSADDKDPVALLQAAQEIMKARRNYVKSMKKDTGVDGGEWSQELNSDQFKEYQDLYNTSIRYTGRMLRQAYELDRRAKLRKEIEAAEEAQRIELEQAKAERAEARAEAERNRKDKKDPKDARPNFAIGQQDRKAKTFGFGANESKITKSTLKSIIAEELAKAKSK